MVRGIIVTLFFGVAVPAAATAETADDFVRRIAAAYAAPDKAVALAALYFFEGMDVETRQMYEDRVIGRHLAKHEAPSIVLEPLPADFNPLQVGGGFEIRPNLAPLGYVALNGKTRLLYGRHGDRYYFVGVIRTPIADPAGPEVMLQMIVLGMGSPQIRFDGHCDLLLANGDTHRVRLHDEGLTSKTMLVSGVRIEGCELRNLSGHGAVMLKLLEGDREIFDRQVDFPQDSLHFRR